MSLSATVERVEPPHLGLAERALFGLALLALVFAGAVPEVTRKADPQLATWAAYFGGGVGADPWGASWHIFWYRSQDHPAFVRAATSDDEQGLARVRLSAGPLEPKGGVLMTQGAGGNVMSTFYSCGPNGVDEQGGGDDVFPSVRSPGAPLPGPFEAIPLAPFLSKARGGFFALAVLLLVSALSAWQARAPRAGVSRELGRVVSLGMLPLVWCWVLFQWLITTPSMPTRWWFQHADQQELTFLLVPVPVAVAGALFFGGVLFAVWVRSRAEA